MKQAIGIFDSGVGGLTVVKEFNKYLPNENIIYFGDTARVPYGSKSPEEILTIVREIISWMLTFDVKAVAMACNTSSALALDIVQSEFDIPIFGLIKPTVNYLNTLNRKPEKIGVIATEATVKSHAYSKSIKTMLEDTEVVEMGCPGLVEIIESGQIKTKLAYREVSRFLEPLISRDIKNIILGCTHYPFLSDLIKDIYNNDVTLINPAEHMVRETKLELETLEMMNNFNPAPTRSYYVSALPLQFIKAGNKLLPGELNSTNVLVEIPGDQPFYQTMAV